MAHPPDNQATAPVYATTSNAVKQPPQQLTMTGADVTYYPDIGIEDDDALLTHLLCEVPWRQQNITLFGKVHPQPRLEAWYGDSNAHYSYSGIVHRPTPWTHELQRLRAQVAALCQHEFNSVLLNYYRNGDDSMGLHADDEPELGRHPVIASLSLGATRRMYFRHRHKADIPTLSLDLPSGSLLIMAGATQENWKHGIRKTRRPCGPRINLTFRRVCGR